MTEQEKNDFKIFALENFNLSSIAEAGYETEWIRNEVSFTEELKNKCTFENLKVLIDNQTITDHAFNIAILLMEVLWLKNTQKIN